MMKILIPILILFCFTSCKSYIDNPKYGKIIDYSFLKIIQFKNYNFLEYRDTMKGIADSQIYYSQHYDVEIPKNIKKWNYRSNVIYLKYDHQQLLAIDTDYINTEKHISNWIEINNEDEIRKYRYDYLTIGEKKCNYDKKFSSNRITKLYSNGKTKILLYNIKPENLKEFEKVKESYKYMN